MKTIKRIASLALLLSASAVYGQVFARECTSQQLQYMSTVRTQNPETIHELFCVTATGVVTQDLPTFTHATISITQLNFLFPIAINTAPTVAAGGCGGAAAGIVTNNSTMAFTFQVGTTPGTTCTINFPSGGNHGWFCNAADMTNPTTGGGYYIKTTTAGTNSAVLTFYSTAGAATAPTASDQVIANCFSS
jgi:hypothetical protein